MVQKTMEALNQSVKSMHSNQAVVPGIAYKKNVDDMGESPEVKVMQLPLEKDTDVQCSEPLFPSAQEYQLTLHSIPLSAESLADFDAVLLCADHHGFDYELILKSSAILIDSRGRFPTSSGVIRT